MDEDFENIRADENALSYFQKNRAFTFSVSVSVILHILLLVIIVYSNQPCTNCKDNAPEKLKPRPKIKAYLLKRPQPQIIPEQEKETVKELINEKVQTITAAKSEKEPADQNKLDAIVQKPVTTRAKLTTVKINYSKLRSSINNVLEQDNQIIKQEIFDDCEVIKKKTGDLDCISNIERLGYNNSDPYHLSNIFKVLDKNPDNKKKERLLAKLKLNEQYITTVLDNKHLPADMREQFKEEIAYIRGEIHYQDCDGKPNSGTCAGEIDLGKIAQLLGLLFSD